MRNAESDKPGIGTNKQPPLRGTNGRFGEYHLLEVLGRGGMATVVRAWGPARPDRPSNVALKFLHATLVEDSPSLAAFQAEGRLGMQLRHPNLGRTFGIEIAGGRTALVLECVDGPSLHTIHRHLLRSPWAPGDAYSVAHLVAELSRGLDALHHLCDEEGRPRRTVHRDVTLGNVIVNSRGAAQLVDFGIAFSPLQTARTAAGLVKGKLAYLAPEYLQGESWDHRIDVWSTGVVLWEMLTGRRLFKGATPSQTVCAVVAAQIPSPSSLRPDLSGELARISLRALARDPARRYETAAALATDLESCLERECRDPRAQMVLRWLDRLPLGAISGVMRVANPTIEDDEDSTDVLQVIPAPWEPRATEKRRAGS